MSYINRQDAGKRLAQVLRRFKSKDAVVLALPRGGIVLGAEVAKELNAPLGLVLVRKIGHPSYAEYAIGAMAEGEKPVYNENEVATIDKQWLKAAEASAQKLIEHRKRLYFGEDLKPPEITNKIALIVDDGIATGLTMEAAVRAVRNKHAKRIIVAVPVASHESIDSLENLADEVIVLDKPETFLGAVGAHYQEFDQVDDEEVLALLREVNHHELETISKPSRT
jgi:predicted phosphoribosyltransferase